MRKTAVQRAGSAWKGTLLVAAMALIAFVGVRTTVARMESDDGKTLVAAGLSQDPFAAQGGTLYLRTFRSLHRMPLTGKRPEVVTRAMMGLGFPTVGDGWVYWVTRPWGQFPAGFEIHRRREAGGQEEIVAHLDDEVSRPPNLAVAAGKLYILANRRDDLDEWETRLIRLSPDGRRETLPLASGAYRPAWEFVVDEKDPDHIVWVRPDEWREEGEVPGVICEASFRTRKVRSLVPVAHPFGLAQDAGRFYWMNDPSPRARPSGPGGGPFSRPGMPVVPSPTAAVQLQILEKGAVSTYSLAAMPAGFRGVLQGRSFYYLTFEPLPGDRETETEVHRLDLGGADTVQAKLRTGGVGPACWLLRDPAANRLYLCERYQYENWFDWSPQGLSARHLIRVWHLKTG
jgi:hypothetical protein